VRVHEKFMLSPGHRANVLDPRFTHGAVGAAAANRRMFQGYVQDTRMYTELFMQARASASAPGSADGSAPSADPAPTATPRPKPREVEVEVDPPRRPRSSAGIDGIATVVSSPPALDLTSRHLGDEAAAARVAELGRRISSAVMSTSSHLTQAMAARGFLR